MANVSILRSGTSGRYYVSFGASRSRLDYATPQNAKRAAEAQGHQVVGHLPDPNAISVARFCRFDAATSALTLTLDKYGDGKETITFSSLALANEMFRKLGYKPVRLTHNLLGLSLVKTIVIDEDTPSYCDPGSEAYHSM